jgi:ATP-dependent DNA helicase RecG
MGDKDVINILEKLLANKLENEVTEFKKAENNFDFNDLGKYFSALSNEANLQNCKEAWLVFGIFENKQNKTLEITGTNYRNSKASLQSLKKELADKTTNRITFREIFEIKYQNKRILLFQIPPAPQGIPVSFEGHYYGRDGESLSALNIEEMERIRFQTNTYDWSREIIPDATIDDLDTDAIAKAKIKFGNRNPKYKKEIKKWDTEKFLDKAKLTLNGKITRACFILLGKDNREHYLDSAVKIRWNLKTLDNQDKDYEIFSIPFIITVEEVFAKIRNLKYQYLPDGTLFPEEYNRFEPFTIREAIHNCIAHQDYSYKARINVVEFEDDHLVFSNYGTFLPKSVEYVVLKDTPEERYRNPFLVEAMRNLDMIETQGGGLRKIFNYQRDRYFPMPEFDFSDERVRFTVTGKIIDKNYARILHRNPKLKFNEVIILDKVQKHKELTEKELHFCKKNNFVIERNRQLELYFEEEIDKEKYTVNSEIDTVKQKTFTVNGKKFTVNGKEFTVNGKEFTVKLTENQKKIFELIEANAAITILEIATYLKISDRAVKTNIAKLKRLNLLERVGSDKTGEWRLIY